MREEVVKVLVEVSQYEYLYEIKGHGWYLSEHSKLSSVICEELFSGGYIELVGGDSRTTMYRISKLGVIVIDNLE